MYVHECMPISVDATFEINLLLNCCHIKQGLIKSDCGEILRKYCNVAYMLKINIGKGGQIKKKPVSTIHAVHMGHGSRLVKTILLSRTCTFFVEGMTLLPLLLPFHSYHTKFGGDVAMKIQVCCHIYIFFVNSCCYSCIQNYESEDSIQL